MTRRTSTALAAATALALTVTAVALAAQGTPDPTFGDGGFAIVGEQSLAFGVAADSSGRLLTAGNAADGRPTVGRFTPAGLPDPTFAAAGPTPGFARLGEQEFRPAVDVAVLSDGAVAAVLAPISSSGTLSSMLATGDGTVFRLTPDGEPDSGFGTGGRLDLAQPVNALVSGPNGGLFAAGLSEDASRLVVLGLTAAGTPLPGFGTEGVAATAPLSGSLVPGDVRLAAGPGGTLTVSGVTDDGSTATGIVARFTAAGQPDESFGGGDGMVALEPPSGYDRAVADPEALAVDASGRTLIYLPTTIENFELSIFSETRDIVRLGVDGTLDSTYAGVIGGTRSFSLTVWAHDLEPQPDGSLVIVGLRDESEVGVRAMVAALTDGGAPDEAFGSGSPAPGVVVLPLGSSEAGELRDGVLLPDGRIGVAGGYAPDVETRQLAVGRIIGDLAPHAGFTGPATAVAGETVTFTSTSSDAEGPISHAWDLDGDGTFETAGQGTTASRAYESPGQLTIGLRVTDLKGRTSTAAQSLTVSAQPAPTPTPTPAPTPNPTPQPPAPSEGRSLVAATKSGSIRLRLPGTTAFIRLSDATQLPLGTEFDARRGHVVLSVDNNGAIEQVELWHGFFRTSQTRGRAPVFTASLTRGSFRSCRTRTRRRGGRRAVTSARRKRVVRRLWGSGRGRFRTRGRYSAATVRGTTWTVYDRCDGTLTRVREGSVTVRDLRRRRSFTVRRGQQRLVRARR